MLLSISLMFVLACLPDTFSGSSGSITYPPTGELYDRNIKCFFKITVAEGQKIKIKFEQFDFAPGYNYNIERTNSDSTAITKKFVGDNFQGMYDLKSLTSKVTPLATRSFKRSYKISHPPQL